MVTGSFVERSKTFTFLFIDNSRVPRPKLSQAGSVKMCNRYIAGPTHGIFHIDLGRSGIILCDDQEFRSLRIFDIRDC